MKLYEIVFSATGRTQKIADIISSEFKNEILKIDLSKVDLENITIEEGNICIIAVPVYGGRVPEPAIRNLKKIDGKNSTAILIAVYGNRAVDDCLLELKDIAEEQHFKCKVAITAVAEHSMMPQYASGRPDEIDIKQLKGYAKQIQEKLENNELSESVKVPGKRPYIKSANMPLKIKVNNDCNKCGICAKNCPVHAIDIENLKITDNKKCITCMRCIEICPKKARSLPKGIMKVTGLAMKSKLSKRKESFIYF